VTVDTGAAPNLIKRSKLESHVKIDETFTLLLSGITDGQVKTMGSVCTKLAGRPITLHVVDSCFPISQDGILGSEFLQGAGKINFVTQTVEWHDTSFPFTRRETIRIPARSSTCVHVRVVNTQVRTGYVPRLTVDHGVYLGDAVVTNSNGKAYLRAFNTSSKDAEFQIPLIEIEEVEIKTKPQDCFADSILGHEAATQVTRNLGCVTRETCKTESDRAKQVEKLLRLEHLNCEESEYVKRLITKNCDVFHLPTDRLGYTHVMKHTITTTDERPINTKQYRYPPIHKEEINKQVKQLLDNDVIKPSASPYNSPLWIVPKKPDSKGNRRWRMVIDYRALNKRTVGDAYPLPNITEILDQLGSAKYFSVFDLASGFHQLQMDSGDAPKTAFSTPYGHYEFNRMPFGLKNAPATFQRLMDLVLSGLQGTELFVYLDDIVIYASSLREHEIKFNKLTARLRESNLKLQPDKCEFLRKEVNYLGHIIGEDGVKPDPKKIEAVKEFPQPANAKNIKQFLGLAGYYRRFIPNFSKTARPLTNLLKKESAFVWTEEQQSAFNDLRNALCSQPILQYPDFARPFVVTTDASKNAIGGILSQGPVGKDLPISYVSRLLNGAEQNYSTIERELLAIVYSVNYFRPYLFGCKFSLVTDHKPLVWLNSVKDPSSRLVRWRLKLAEYDYEMLYKAGKINANADALSRNPIPKQVLPVSSDSSNNSLFHAPSSNKTQTPHKPAHEEKIRETPEDPNENKASLDEQNIEETINSSFTSDGQDALIEDSGSDSDEPLFDPVDELYQVNRAKITDVRDNLNSRNDNLVVFTTSQGKPCDEGARILQSIGRLPEIKDAMVGRATVTKWKKKHIITLVIEDRVSALTQVETIKETIASLCDVTTELQLSTVSISKGLVLDVPWETICNLITKSFRDLTTRIIVCSNQITTPPEENREDVIKENHATVLGGHKGVTKTINRIKYRYHWPRMKRDVQEYIKRCKECQLKKLVRLKTRQPMVITDTPETAFEKVSMDIMGPLPTTKNESKYILTIQDLLTKYSLAIPLESATAVHVADAFINEFICTFGAPRTILTDQGSNFINSLMRNISRKFGIRQCQTTAYRPQSNGSVERSHQVLWEYLKQFAKENNWDEYLKLASFSYNTSVHEGTRYTPFELVFGKVANTPSNDPPLGPEVNETYTQYLTSLFNKLRDTQNVARENLTQAKIKSKQLYDRKMRPRNFNIGDLVYMLKEPTKNKLANQYVGPYEVLDILDKNNAKIRISNGRVKTIHTDKLKIAEGSAPTTPVNPRHATEPHTEPSDKAAVSEESSPEQLSLNTYNTQKS